MNVEKGQNNEKNSNLLYLLSPFGAMTICFLIGPGITFGTIISLVNYIKSLKIVYADSEYDVTNILYKLQLVGAIVGIIMVVVIVACSILSIFYAGSEDPYYSKYSIIRVICPSGFFETRFFQGIFKYTKMLYQGIGHFYVYKIYAPIMGLLGH